MLKSAEQKRPGRIARSLRCLSVQEIIQQESLLWPLFLGIQFIIDVQALFSTHLGWKPIPHNDRTSFDALHAGETAQAEIRTK